MSARDYLTMRRRTKPTPLLLSILAAITMTGCGDEPTTTSTAEAFVDGLNNPTGIAVLADGSLVVAESGAARLITVAADGSTAPLAAGFQLGTYFPYDIGPLSVHVTVDGTIIVGEGGASAGRERISFFDAQGAAIPDQTLIPVSGGNFYGLAIHPLTADLFVSSADRNAIFQASRGEDGNYGEPTEFVADTTQPPIGRSAPTALAFEADGSLLVAFADDDGGAVLRLATDTPGSVSVIAELYSGDGVITAIALRPSDGNVFFAEYDPSRPTQGRVAGFTEEGNDRTVLSNLTMPSALAFATDDTLYIATLGATPNTTTGAILVVRSNSSDPPSEPAPDVEDAPDAP